LGITASVAKTGAATASSGPDKGAQTRQSRKRLENPLRDGFIAEAALLNDMTLVTADTRLAQSARMLGADVELIP
jgi:predicted nucleic acid-binding protein